ncbi:coiled-coil domain-containing protein 62 [Elgaria multicarinata webbii]|uniref:coiled-coil domain-containing protein 62 n=1 Tax=Elgaria multicarinata webbii TaxID=159646 RepID=UPI002FCCB92F
MNSSLPLSTPPQNGTSGPESSTVQKQRRELQLLIAELKDRDKELNAMVAVHQKQLLAWEDDRQKILTLAERCSSLENELHKRNEMITALTRRLKLLETQQNDRKVTLETTQQKLQELSRKASDTTSHCQALEEKNQVLSCSVMELSNKVGQLQAREQELLTMLKLKDNDILEASNHISEFTCKFKKLENALRAAKMEESSISREKRDFKLRLKELMLETNKLKGDLSEKTKESNEQREEIIRLKQENGYLNNELMLSAERANRKDQLLQSAKSKQLRTDMELSNLRQVYVKQQRDLQFLHFNLESSQEMKQKPKMEAHEASRGMVLSDLESSSDRDTVCSEISRKIHTRFVCLPGGGRKEVCRACRAESGQLMGSTGSDQFPEGLLHGPTPLPRDESRPSGSLSPGEASSRPASRAEGAWKTGAREAARAPGLNHATSLPIHEHWFPLDPSNCRSSGPGHCGNPGGDCGETETAAAAAAAMAAIPNEPPSPAGAPEAGCCSRSSLGRGALYQSVSDREWMRIFKPVKGGGGARCGASPSTPPAAQGMQRATSKSGHNTDALNFLDLDAPCLTSTQRTSGPRRHEAFFHAALPSELVGLTDAQAAGGCGHPTVHSHDSCSPTTKLQRLLAESRQMVADLELSDLLGASPAGSPSGSLHMAMACAESLGRGRLPAAEEGETKLSLFSL